MHEHMQPKEIEDATIYIYIIWQYTETLTSFITTNWPKIALCSNSNLNAFLLNKKIQKGENNEQII